LTDEIKIVQPDVILFFSGPNYDDKIKIQFNETPQFVKVFDDIPIRELARVAHDDLPYNSYRAYHPAALQRQNKLNQVERLIEKIKKERLDFSHLLCV
jgi:hypothetical protein